MEVCGQFFVGKEDVHLLVARRANVDCGPQVGVVVFVFGFLFTLGLLAGNEVMLGELRAIAITQFTRFFACFHRLR